MRSSVCGKNEVSFLSRTDTFSTSAPATVRATPRQQSSPPTPEAKCPKLEEPLYEVLDEAQTEIDKRIEELEVW